MAPPGSAQQSAVVVPCRGLAMQQPRCLRRRRAAVRTCLVLASLCSGASAEETGAACDADEPHADEEGLCCFSADDIRLERVGRAPGQLEPGDDVKLVGLTARPELNDQIVQVVGRVPAKGDDKWEVRLAGQEKPLCVKAERLARLRPAC